MCKDIGFRRQWRLDFRYFVTQTTLTNDIFWLTPLVLTIHYHKTLAHDIKTNAYFDNNNDELYGQENKFDSKN